jgi:hypothetical protein
VRSASQVYPEHTQRDHQHEKRNHKQATYPGPKEIESHKDKRVHMKWSCDGEDCVAATRSFFQ